LRFLRRSLPPPVFCLVGFRLASGPKIWRNRAASQREITAKVSSFTAGVSDFDGIVSRLAVFVQRDIRYVANEIGNRRLAASRRRRHLSQPLRGLQKTRQRCSAPCLQVAGIHAENVLIYAEHGVTREDSPGNYFNHAILAIELPADAEGDLPQRRTDQVRTALSHLRSHQRVGCRFGELGEYEQGNFALLEGANGRRVDSHCRSFPPEQKPPGDKRKIHHRPKRRL